MRLKYTLQYLFSYNFKVQFPTIVVDSTPEGARATIALLGGEVDGPRLRGEVLPGGADWPLIRTDGVLVVDVRLMLRTHDNALINMVYSGLLDAGPQGYDKFVTGDLAPHATVRTAHRFHTGHPDYQWLNRLQCFGIGEVDTARARVVYDVYALDV
jgi:hypothetical protein